MIISTLKEYFFPLAVLIITVLLKAFEIIDISWHLVPFMPLIVPLLAALAVMMLSHIFLGVREAVFGKKPWQ